MHISEGFLPLSHCIAWGAAVSGPDSGQRARDFEGIGQEAREPSAARGLRGVSVHVNRAAGCPRSQAVPHTPPVRLSATYLFGPSAMPALALITLVFQALLLAHGGLTTLGSKSVFPRRRWSLGHVAPAAAALATGLEARPLHLPFHRSGRSGNLRHHRLPAGARLSFRPRWILRVFCEVPGRISDHPDSHLDRGRVADRGAAAEPGRGPGTSA